MEKEVRGYWLLSWVGLFANVIALPFIAFVVSQGPPLKAVNLIMAISIAWPAAIVGIIAASGLLAQRSWGITLSIIASSMVIAGTTPYGIIRLVKVQGLFGLGGFVMLISILNLMALIYWCLPRHRRKRF